MTGTDGAKRVMIVDDNPDDVYLTLRAFRDSPLQGDIVVARSGKEALENLLALPERERPAIVLLDVNMPCLSGLEVLASLRSNPACRGLKIVMLTSSKEPCDRQEAGRLGADLFLTKPDTIEEYDELVRAIEELSAGADDESNP